MHRGEVFHLLWWQNDTKPSNNDNNIFILIYPFTHKVCKALGKQQLSGWKCPERLCPGLLLEWDREAQSCSPARSQGGCKGRGSMGHFRQCPHLCLPILMPLAPFLPAASLQSVQVPTRAGLAGGEGKLKPAFTSLSASEGL